MEAKEKVDCPFNDNACKHFSDCPNNAFYGQCMAKQGDYCKHCTDDDNFVD